MRHKSSKFNVTVYVDRQGSGAARHEKFVSTACVEMPGGSQARAKKIRSGKSPRCGTASGATVKEAVRGALRVLGGRV